MKKFFTSENGGLRVLAFVLALLLWIYVNFFENGGIDLMKSIPK